MIVIPSIVEPNEVLRTQCLHRFGGRIDPCLDVVLVTVLKADHEEIREDLHIIEGQHRGICGLLSLRNILMCRLELHVRHTFHTILCIVCGIHGEVHDILTHVGDIILDLAVIGFVENLTNEVNTRFSTGLVFFLQIAPDERSDMRFILEDHLIDHGLFSFEW